MKWKMLKIFYYFKPWIVLLITKLPYNKKLSLLLDKLDAYEENITSGKDK